MILSLYSIKTGKILTTGKNVHEVIRNYAKKAYFEEIEHCKKESMIPDSYIQITRYIINMYLKGHIATEIY